MDIRLICKTYSDIWHWKLDNILIARAKARGSRNVVLSKDAKNIIDLSDVKLRSSKKSRHQMDLIDDPDKEAPWLSGAHYEEEGVGRIDPARECSWKEK